MNKPFHPMEPVKPKETIMKCITINMHIGQTLSEIPSSLPNDIDFNEVHFNGFQNYDGIDEPRLEYWVSELNSHYEADCKRYEKKRREYEEALPIYTKELAVYNEWETSRDKQKQKVKELEAQLRKLKKEIGV